MKAIVVFAAVGTLAVAQEQSRQTIMLQSAGEPGHMRVRVDAEPGTGNVVFNKDVVVTTDAVKMGFVAAEMSMGGKILKGAPYSADTVSETIQTLSDGNRIVRKSTGAVYRDSEGRTRREQTIDSIGPWSTSNEPLKSVTITDPVSAATYFLDSRAKEAHKVPAVQANVSTRSAANGPATASMNAAVITKMRAEGVANQANVKEESIGKQTIEGLLCDGTRIVSTIPAGAMGNEKAIEVVTERWYSPELQVIVLSKHSDPRMGETTFRLERVSRNEPARSLFEVPSDYNLSTESPRMRTFKFENKEE